MWQIRWAAEEGALVHAPSDFITHVCADVSRMVVCSLLSWANWAGHDAAPITSVRHPSLNCLALPMRGNSPHGCGIGAQDIKDQSPRDCHRIRDLETLSSTFMRDGKAVVTAARLSKRLCSRRLIVQSAGTSQAKQKYTKLPAETMFASAEHIPSWNKSMRLLPDRHSKSANYFAQIAEQFSLEGMRSLPNRRSKTANCFARVAEQWSAMTFDCQRIGRADQFTTMTWIR